MVEVTLTMPSGEKIEGIGPVVVIGPNGSGKTRQTRSLTSPAPIEFINALRNTRVAPELPAMGMTQARSNFDSQRNNSRANHWELSSEFDYMLSQLLGEKSDAAMEFVDRFNTHGAAAVAPEQTTLTHVEALWAEVFPGRELHWKDWKPLVKNRTTGAEAEYSGNHMSDGEKAALYLMARVFSTAPGSVVVVDEPETHLHSLLAVRLWNAIERARPDLRFVYVTHDLTFALSRQAARFVLASPTQGLRTISLDGHLPPDVAEALLGSASLSFYASRVVFCEGEESSLDSTLYQAWFSGPDTVVKAVDNCHRVLRCADALANAGITSSLEAVGIVDGDYHPESFRESLPAAVTMLRVHEVESLFALPGVVAAVGEHLGRPVDLTVLRSRLAATVTDVQARKIILERWKRVMEPRLEALLSAVSTRSTEIDDVVAALPEVFDHTKWEFSPRASLEAERVRVEEVRASGETEELLAIFPGKQMLPEAASFLGLTLHAYKDLVITALGGSMPNGVELRSKIEAALSSYLPPRYVAVAGVPVAL